MSSLLTRNNAISYHAVKSILDALSAIILMRMKGDGIKVRFKIQVVTGKRAAAIDERQADAIRELLIWTRQQRTQQPPSR
jgi:hypothetical protein